MLEATDMQIKEIGTAAGFPNPQYFNKRFREITGVSPSEYRNKSI
jgi:transcriptional regulator GlxA family with amidase domain